MGSRGGANDGGGGDDWLNNGAWAWESDGLASSSSDGLAVVGEGGGSWAHSGVLSVDLGGVDNGSIVAGRDTSNESGGSGEDLGELHFEGGVGVVGLRIKVDKADGW